MRRFIFYVLPTCASKGSTIYSLHSILQLLGNIQDNDHRNADNQREHNVSTDKTAHRCQINR